MPHPAPTQPETVEGAVCLTTLSAGESARVVGLSGTEADGRTLRAMGLAPEALITVRRIGEPCVVEVRRSCDCSGGHCSRIGLARTLAGGVRVARG